MVCKGRETKHLAIPFFGSNIFDFTDVALTSGPRDKFENFYWKRKSAEDNARGFQGYLVQI